MDRMIRTTAHFEFGAVQTSANLVDLETAENGHLVEKIGFDGAENEPSKIYGLAD